MDYKWVSIQIEAFWNLQSHQNKSGDSRNSLSMKRKSSIRIKWKGLLKVLFLAFFLLIAILFLYSWNLSERIDQRFSSRRWSIPSKVFSDITILYPGQKLNRDSFDEKLRQLGYHLVPHKPREKGEFEISGNSLLLFLHDLKMPSLEREGFLVNIRFTGNRIESILRADTEKPIPLLELEPEEIMLFFGTERERRTLVSIDQVPQHLISAVLAAEDSRFYRHFGIDPLGILRAFYTNLRQGALRQGGSTLTQQLAKNYFLTPDRTIPRKLKEMIISLIIEALYKKDEILEIYLNEIYFGQNGSVSINGVGEASLFYFGKSVNRLSRIEAATLAGLIRAPNHYSPYVDEKRCLNRRNMVLKAMHKNGWLSNDALQTDVQMPVNVSGFTDYGKKAPYFIDYLSQQLEALYSTETLSSMGLSIYTTLDTQVQAAAEKALEKGLDRMEKSIPILKRTAPSQKLQGAIIVMQPKTGYILAMVGGRNYRESQFNRVIQARRQPGSLFKPFVFCSALDRFTPASLLSNEPASYQIDGVFWRPENFEPVSEKCVSLRTALKKSYNLATVDLAMKIGMDHIVQTAASFHFSTPIKAYPSLALGAFEVIPIELARAYSVFAADGFLPYPLSLREVTDEDGKILQQRHMNVESLISPAKAFIMNSMLRSVITEGTASSLTEKGIFGPVAGKTGTTNNYRDAWFLGYTPEILALVWVGFDNGDSIYSTGTKAAMPIWADLMKNIPQHISENWFNMPPGITQKTVCSESGLLAVTNGCPHPVEEIFLEENLPTLQCPLHRKEKPLHHLTKELKELLKAF